MGLVCVPIVPLFIVSICALTWEHKWTCVFGYTTQAQEGGGEGEGGGGGFAFYLDFVIL